MADHTHTHIINVNFFLLGKEQERKPLPHTKKKRESFSVKKKFSVCVPLLLQTTVGKAETYCVFVPVESNVLSHTKKKSIRRKHS